MAGHRLEELDEFFDFTRLEADMNDGLHTACQPGRFSSEALSGPERHAAMEWEPSSPGAPADFDALYMEPFPSSSECGVFQPYCGYTPQTPTAPQWHEPPPEQNDGCNGALTAAGVPSPPYAVPQMELFEPIQQAPLSHVAVSPLSKSSTRHIAEERPRRLPIRAEFDSRKPASAKHKGSSTRIPLEARQMLEDEFSTNPYPCSWEIDIIAHQASLDAKRVRNWFNNARARKKVQIHSSHDRPTLGKAQESAHSLTSKLSAESLEALSKQVDEGVSTPQPPLAVYLASSYLEEAAKLSDIQAAIGTAPSTEKGDSSSGSWMNRSASVVTSQTSSDGSAPTTYTLSSGGSNTSSFGRDRRRGRRRMTWRNSPYSRPKIDGLNDAGLPSRNLPFFCTFCPRAFKTKYEWTRHEDSVHALRTTWICCSNKRESFEICPFCGDKRPDEVHLAAHKYQQCRNKPEAHRTFYRRDHFIQHLHHVHFGNAKHPSTRFGCGTRAVAGQSNDYGCKELAMKWRRFGAPIKSDDPMLHCGFCGKTLQGWNTRCDHVAEHLLAGGWDRSAWWPERRPIHMDNLFMSQAAGPFRCRYCRKVFENAGAMNNHSHCRVWSCRFLRTFDDVASENSGPPLCPQFPSPKAHHCHLCGAGYRSGHVEHAQQYHNYRLCKQDIYTSKEDFLQHLHEFHAASNPLLLVHNAVLEQHFSRNKGASFEPVDFDEILQGCRVATPTSSFVDPFTERIEALPSLSSEEIVDWAHTITAMPGKKTGPHNPVSEIPVKAAPEPPLKDASPKVDPPGPRIFRLDPLVPFLSSRIYYLRNAKMSELFNDGKALLKEVERGHVASLVMSSGLLGMAGVRMPVQMKKYEGGLAEFALEED